mgnify:CR=1 FL=1
MKNSKSNWLIFMCWLVYTSSYLGRYSYNSNMVSIINYYQINHASAGLVTTFFFFAYGIGQIINGLCCKYYNKRGTIGLVLIVSAFINFVAFFDIPFACMKYLWLLYGFLQSFIWPLLIYILASQLKQQELKKSVVVMGTTVACGTLFIYGISALFALFNGFKYVFLLSFILMFLVGICWLIFYPKLTCNPTIKEKIENDSQQNIQKHIEKSVLIILMVLAFLAIINNLLKDGLTIWLPSILQEKYNFSDSLSISLTLILPILGTLGTILAVSLSKKINSIINLVSLLFLLSTISLTIIIFFFKTPYWFIVLFFFCLISLFMHGINNIITSMAPLFLRNKINSGMVAGILNGFCYVGSTISSYLLGVIVDHYGWNYLLYMLLIINILAFIIPLFINFIKIQQFKITS